MKFAKYHALGNDYIVMHPGDAPTPLTAAAIRLICDRHYGVGSDGLLIGPLPAQGCDFCLRLFNPDGSEFEKSGNGLRIFGRYLWDGGLVGDAPFTVWTPGGAVRMQVYAQGSSVTVDMGAISFDSERIPVAGPRREVLNEDLTVGERLFRVCAATIGNPHCVVLSEQVSPQEAQQWGPLIETDPCFPNRINVQFMRPLSRHHIQIEIWERGAGYTLASGSSSCAAAAVACRLGWCESPITVSMPGGTLHIVISPDWSVSMTGPVTKICEGVLSPDMLIPSRPAQGVLSGVYPQLV